MRGGLKAGSIVLASVLLITLVIGLVGAQNPAPATVASTCTFGGTPSNPSKSIINQNNWVYINVLIILLTLTVSSVIYAFANFLPIRESSKIKGYVKYEYVQCVISIAVIVALIFFSAVACNYSVSITGTDPFSSAQTYVGSLVFINGTNIITHLYTAAVETTINGQVIGALAAGGVGQLGGWLASKITSGPLSVGPISIGFSPSSTFPLLFTNFGDVLVDFYSPLVIATFGMLFLQYLTLPVVASVALTIVVPLALLIRSFGFVGPKLREAADSFLGIAIAFYFVYPMTFVMDQQIIAWTFCTHGAASVCNPYFSSYPMAYTINNIGQSALFSTNTAKINGYYGTSFSVPISFYGSLLSDLGGGNNALTLPFNLVYQIGEEIAVYMFKGVVLIALDLAITVGFGLGVTKAITSSLAFITEGSLW